MNRRRETRPAPGRCRALLNLLTPCPFLRSLTLIAGVAAAAGAGSIFDDDWVPPKPAEPTVPAGPRGPATRPMTPAPPPAPPARVPLAPSPLPRPGQTPAPAVSPPPAPPAAPAPLSTGRRPLPSRPDQAKSRKLLKEVYAEPLKDHSVAGRRKFAQTLLDDVPRYGDNPTDQFVLLGGAIDAARDGASLPLSFRAADLMARAYDVDGLLVKADAACRTLARPGTASAENLRAGLELVGQLMDADETAAAARVVAVLQPAAAGDATLQKAVQQRRQEVDAARLARERLAQQLEKLKTSPDDPAANFAVGGFLCFTKGQWDRGLPMLAKGADPAIRTLAAAELAGPTAGEALAGLGDGWFDAAAKQPAPLRPRVLQHAGKLYRQSLAGTAPVTGLHRKLIEQRLATLPPGEGQRINLLALLDPARDTVTGAWRISDGTLVSTSAWKGRVEFPYVPPEEYDYRVTFTFRRLAPSTERADYGHDGTRQICYAGGRQFAWVLGAVDDRLSWFDQVNGFGWVPANPTVKQSAAWLQDGHRHTSLVKVRRDHVEGYLDDALVSGLQTDYRNLALWDGDRLRRPNTLGLGVWKDSVTLESAEVQELSGEGTVLTGDAGLAPDPADGPSARGREAIVLGSGAWAIEGEELAQTAADRTSAVIFGDPTWSHYDLTLKAKAVEGRDGFRLVFHSVDTANLGQIQLGAAGNTRYDFIFGCDNRFTGSSRPGHADLIERDRWYDVRLEVRGPQTTCYLDGARLVSYSDPQARATHGRVGVACGATAVRFRDIVVTSEDGKTVLWKGNPKLPERP